MFLRLWPGVLFLALFGTGLSAEKNTFRLGVQDFKEYLPYSQYTGGQYYGFNRELLELFARDRGYVFQYHPLPLKRLYRAFLRGEVDLKYPDNPYWNADLKKGKQIKYSDPVVEYVDGVLVAPDNKGRGLKHLRNLGIIAGFTPLGYLDLMKTGTISIVENASYEALLIQVLKGRVDGAYANIAVSHHYLEHILNKQDALVFDPDLPHTHSARHLSSFKYPQLVKEFNHFLRAEKEAIEKLKARHRVEWGITTGTK